MGYSLVISGPALRVLTAFLLVGGLAGCTEAAQGTPPPASAPVVDIPVDPFEAAISLLRKQSAALLGGDETGRLAPVDPGQPALRARYRAMFDKPFAAVDKDCVAWIRAKA